MPNHENIKTVSTVAIGKCTCV